MQSREKSFASGGVLERLAKSLNSLRVIKEEAKTTLHEPMTHTITQFIHTHFLRQINELFEGKIFYQIVVKRLPTVSSFINGIQYENIDPQKKKLFLIFGFSTRQQKFLRRNKVTLESSFILDMACGKRYSSQCGRQK